MVFWLAFTCELSRGCSTCLHNEHFLAMSVLHNQQGLLVPYNAICANEVSILLRQAVHQ